MCVFVFIWFKTVCGRLVWSCRIFNRHFILNFLFVSSRAFPFPHRFVEKDLKEFTDAEGLMALPTSDYQRTTVCRAHQHHASPGHSGTYQIRRCIAASSAATIVETDANFSPATSNVHENLTAAMLAEPTQRLANNYNAHKDRQLCHSNNLIRTNYNNSGDLASLDSSDTYASCQTHPFLSQGDLTGEMADISYTLAELDVHDSYFATLDTDQAMVKRQSFDRSQVKKSASGDASLHSLAACISIADSSRAFQSFDIDRGSHASLNEPTLPKHRKTRFQQSSLHKASTVSESIVPSQSMQQSVEDAIPPMPSSSTGTIKKPRRSSFMPTKTATKLINMLGIQNTSAKGTKLVLMEERTYK